MAQDSEQAGATYQISLTPAALAAGADVLRLAALSVEPCCGEEDLIRDVIFAMVPFSKKGPVRE